MTIPKSVRLCQTLCGLCSPGGPPGHGSRGGAGPVDPVVEDSVLFANPASPPDVLGSSSISGSCHSQPPLIPARFLSAAWDHLPQSSGRGAAQSPGGQMKSLFFSTPGGWDLGGHTCSLRPPEAAASSGDSHPPLNSWLSLCLFSRNAADVGTTVPQLV